MKYKDIIYMCSDLAKTLTSDDSYYTELHIKFLLSKHRAQLLYEKYKSGKEPIPQSNYQTICLTTEKADMYNEDICGDNTYLRTVEVIPDVMSIGNTSIYPINFFNSNITWIDRERMKYVGENKYMSSIIYASLGADNHVYFKSSNPQHMYLCKVKMTALFEDMDKASELSCDSEGNKCDYMEQDFRIEDTLVPQLILTVVQELTGVKFQPKDYKNNSSDDLAELAAFIRNNTKSVLAKQMTE